MNRKVNFIFALIKYERDNIDNSGNAYLLRTEKQYLLVISLAKRQCMNIKQREDCDRLVFTHNVIFVLVCKYFLCC